MDDEGDRGTRGNFDGNVATILLPHDVAGKLRRAPLDAHDAFVVAYERLTTLASVARRPSMIAVAVDGDARVVESLLVECGRALVIGRHTQCSLRLPGRSVALRHLAILVRPGAASNPVAHVWDLNTGSPFITEDGQDNAALIADGPTYLAIDEYAIWIVPATIVGEAWPTAAEAAWRTLPPRHFVERRAPPAERRDPVWVQEQPFEPGRTFITLVRPPLVLGEEDSAEQPWGELRVERGKRKDRCTVSAERLEQGVLLGRYQRCGLAFGLDAEGVSRVHLLLVRIGDGVWAIDTASTNGLWRGEIPFGAGLLEDEDAIELGSAVTLRWRRLPRAAA